MATQPKRKSPETGARGRKPQQSSRVTRMLMASAALIGRHPRALGGLVAFGVIFSFVAANALWYQPRRHPAPFLATRATETTRALPAAELQAEATEPGVTVFRIERESDEPVRNPKPSELVREIQRALSARGLYDGPADGLTGPKTEAAVLFFEQTEGMEETGEPSRAILDRLRQVSVAKTDETDAGLRTASTRAAPRDEVAALIAAAEKPVAVIPAEKPVSPALVMQIQKALAGMAYAGVKVDGIPGEATRSAIRAFEKSYRLPVTGEPSDRVLRKLKSIGAI
ncbi:MAG: peptidoglycan-binding protein [Rhizobiaceae bacterium]|nr:peptidoglycan-binding protein [Rhizobiaceae bacterium]